MREFFSRHLALLTFLGAGVLFVLIHGGPQKYVKRRTEYRAVQKEIFERSERMTGKKRRISRLETNSFYSENEARRQLGLVRPGEIEFRFVERSDGRPEEMKVWSEEEEGKKD
ncbi:MAG TPA: septum formation initiator family protein [Elusimicrobiota bacterium]|nr:septum formation initiator family protein [Elusimicrobiota bacterium]